MNMTFSYGFHTKIVTDYPLVCVAVVVGDSQLVTRSTHHTVNSSPGRLVTRSTRHKEAVNSSQANIKAVLPQKYNYPYP